jgi:predicted PurR-regulated permease PerM
MPPIPPRASPGLQSKALVVLVVAVSVLFGIVLWPLARAVAWAIFIAIVFKSWHERATVSFRGRRGWAAFVTLLVIVVGMILPMVLLGAAVANEASAFYGRIRAGEVGLADYFDRAIAALPEWVRTYVARIGLDELGTVQRKIVELIGRRSQQITTQAFTIGQGTLDFLVNLFVMLYLLFFLLRDGKDLVAKAERMLPLEPHQTRRLLNEFTVVVRATVKGNVVVALVQGALGWLAFWFLGITGALLWGAVMALLSLLPAVGAALCGGRSPYGSSGAARYGQASAWRSGARW